MARAGSGPAVPQVVISYAREDSAAVVEFVRLLEAAGIHAWIDHEDIDGAQLWAGQIAEAIDACSVVLLFLSQKAVTSKAVQREIALAFDGDKQVLPLLLEPVTMPSSMRYQLAGVQHVDLYSVADPAERVPVVLRALQRLGVTPGGKPKKAAAKKAAPAVVTSGEVPVITGDTPVVTHVPEPSSSGPGNRRGVLIGAIAALVLALVVGVVAFGGGGDDDKAERTSSDETTSSSSTVDSIVPGPTDGTDGPTDGPTPTTEPDDPVLDVEDGDLLYVRTDDPVSAGLPLHTEASDSSPATNYQNGVAGFTATGEIQGEWIEVHRENGVVGWFDEDGLRHASGIASAERAAVVEDLGYTLLRSETSSKGLEIMIGSRRERAGELQLTFWFLGDLFAGVDAYGYPSHEIPYVNVDETVDAGANVGYTRYNGIGTAVPDYGQEGNMFYDVKQGGVYAYAGGDNPKLSIPPLDPPVAAAFGAPDQGAENGHR